MSAQENHPGKSEFKLSSILRARCPSCHEGSVLKGIVSFRKRCVRCGYDFHPEPGFYLGATMVGFFLTAMATIPPLIILKLMDASTEVLVIFPFLEFIFVGTFLMFYSKIVWLHLEYRTMKRLDGHAPKEMK